MTISETDVIWKSYLTKFVLPAGNSRQTVLSFLCISFHRLWRDLQWDKRWNQCNKLTLFRILLLGNLFTVSKLKHTSGFSTFPNRVLLVRPFDYSIIVMNLLQRGCVTTGSPDVPYVEWIYKRPNNSIYWGPVKRATFFFNLSRNIAAVQVETHWCAYYHVCDQLVLQQNTMLQVEATCCTK